MVFLVRSFACLPFGNFCNALKACAVVEMLSNRRTKALVLVLLVSFLIRMIVKSTLLTAWYNDPYKVEEEVVGPEVVSFRSKICDVEKVVIEKTGRIVKHVAIYLTKRDQGL